MRILIKAQRQASAEQGYNESFNTENPLEHAESNSSVGGIEDVLSAVTSDSSDLLVEDNPNGVLLDVTPSSEVREELKKEEAVEDLVTHITTAEPVLNKDESNLKNGLDLKINNRNPEAAKILDMAHVAAAD